MLSLDNGTTLHDLAHHHEVSSLRFYCSGVIWVAALW